jgi:hypothetical protein
LDGVKISTPPEQKESNKTGTFLPCHLMTGTNPLSKMLQLRKTNTMGNVQKNHVYEKNIILTL